MRKNLRKIKERRPLSYGEGVRKKNPKIAEFNKEVAAKRMEKLHELRGLLRDKKMGPILLDAETRSVARKFAKLPFGCITDSCAGHFMESPAIGKRVSPEKILPNQSVYATGADFEIMLDFSKPATEFRKALGELDNLFGFKVFVPAGGFCYVRVPVQLIKKIGKKQAMQIRKTNLRLIEKFEKIVERFVARYGVEVKL